MMIDARTRTAVVGVDRMGWKFPCFCSGDGVWYWFEFGGFRLRFVNVDGNGGRRRGWEGFGGCRGKELTNSVKRDGSVEFWRVGLFSAEGLRC